MSLTRQQIIDATLAVRERLRDRSPRVQCLTNTVAQPITANVLLAVGARVSMATHPDEVAAMTATADAWLINLGTLDEARLAAIPLLLANTAVMALPRVLDPVFVEHSPLRLALARTVVAAGPLIVKGNAAEIAALALAPDVTCVETGAVDHIRWLHGRMRIANGDPGMALVTGLGCALGALMAGCAAVEADAVRGSAAAAVLFGLAGERAARRSTGPGSLAVALLDELHTLDPHTINTEARIFIDA